MHRVYVRIGVCCCDCCTIVHCTVVLCGYFTIMQLYVVYLCVHLPVVSLSSIMLLVGLVAEEVDRYAVQVRQDVAKPSDTDD